MPVADDFRISVDEIPEPGPGQVLVRVSLVSLDPAMRGWLDDRPSYLPPIAIDEVIRAGAVGEVVESRNPRFPVGALVQGGFGVALLPRAAVERLTGFARLKPLTCDAKLQSLPIHASYRTDPSSKTVETVVQSAVAFAGTRKNAPKGRQKAI